MTEVIVSALVSTVVYLILRWSNIISETFLYVRNFSSETKDFFTLQTDNEKQNKLIQIGLGQLIFSLKLLIILSLITLVVYVPIFLNIGLQINSYYIHLCWQSLALLFILKKS